MRDRHDPETYGGAYLLGVRGLSVIAHGNSSRRAIRNAILYAARGVEHGVVDRMAAAGWRRRPTGTDLQDADPATYSPAPSLTRRMERAANDS